MKFRSVILSVLVPVCSYSQSVRNDTIKTVVKEVVFKSSVEMEEPPPPGFKSKFKSLTQWLTAVANGNQPRKMISKFGIGLFEAPDSYTLSLTGINTYNEGVNLQSTRIDYTPRDMYCDLQKSYYQNLNREQLLAKIVAELKSFTQTSAFKNSFLAKADNMVLETNGEVIWTKK
jgi:hypothetical protein